MGEALKINAWLDFVTQECGECGVVFAVSRTLHSKWMETGQNWYCPNGHNRHFTETTAQKLQRDLDAAKRDAEWQRQRAETAAKRAEKAEKATARLNKRVNYGVCPHCQRTFTALADHIKAKHPDEAPKPLV